MSRSCISDIDLKPLIDDMNPEFYNHVSGQLLAPGALDISLVAIQMKMIQPDSAELKITQVSRFFFRRCLD